MKQQVRALETQVIKGAVGLDYFLFFRRQAGKHSLTEAVMGIGGGHSHAPFQRFCMMAGARNAFTAEVRWLSSKNP